MKELLRKGKPMKRYMPSSVMVFVLLFTQPPSQAARPSPLLQQTVAKIKKLGGRVELEGQVFGHTLYQPSVSFHGKQVTDASLLILKAIPNLRELSLSRCRVTDSGLARLKGFTELKVLRLEGSQFTDAGLVHLKGLTNIVALSLQGTSITDAGLKNLEGMVKLSRLRLYGTQVRGDGLVHLKRLALRKLDLARTTVGNAGLHHLKGQTELRELRLDETRVADQDLVYLKSLQNLHQLTLAGTRVSDAGLVHFQHFQHLKFLDLSNTRVSIDAVRTLEQKFPKLSVRSTRNLMFHGVDGLARFEIDGVTVVFEGIPMTGDESSGASIQISGYGSGGSGTSSGNGALFGHSYSQRVNTITIWDRSGSTEQSFGLKNTATKLVVGQQVFDLGKDNKTIIIGADGRARIVALPDIHN